MEGGMPKKLAVQGCPVTTALVYIGGRWKPIIVWYLLQDTKRFAELRRAVGGISEKVLSQQLKQLESSGLVKRVSYPEIPPRVEYSLTARGLSLREVIETLGRWGMAQKNRP
jgi:DNA-binding HxlR family transcriptional regulator